jgi:hypothetical protein
MASPEVNVSCGITCDKVCGHFFFAEGLVRWRSYLSMPQLFLFPQLKRGRSLAIWSTAALVDKVNSFLNDTLSDIWSGCGGSVAWPPSSPDLTTPDFFVCGDL